MKPLLKSACMAMAGLTLATVSNLYSPTAQAQTAEHIRDTAKQTLQAFNIPGLAVVAVKDGKVILAEGFGVRDIKTQQPVNAETLFGIASNTKAFTAAAMATLVEQGRLDWDDKVIDYIPEFRLADPAITQSLTIRDILSHRSGLGLGAGDLMIWPNTDKSVDEIIAGLAHVPIDHGLRERFAYNNLMFLTAGEIIHRVTGMPYRDYITKTFLEPLNMDKTTVGFSHIPKSNNNVAVGTIEMDGELHRFPLDFLEDFGGAGAIAASVDDLSNWLITQLNGGVSPTGKRIFSEDSQHQMWQLTTPLPVSDERANDGTYFAGYGMGWFLKDYHGVKQVYHSGGILGMLSLTTLIPEKNFGIVVLSNQQAFGGLTAITQEALEQLLNLPDRDWVKEQAEKYHESMQNKTEFAIEKPANPRSALALENYAGTYHDAWYGDVSLTLQDGKLRVSFTHTPMLKGTLEHYNGDTFIIRWDEPLLEADAFLHFSVDKDSQVQGATVEAAAPFTDFSFDFQDLQLQKLQQDITAAH
ncbi:serine hydrolase [Idiomarina tyrosinivorans]|uniref:Serine hydrolase n=1 Tax=Idiomarina tyrosinivorans TaxID=1445662 RepID=A0A432ZTC2_9GAMM|nr:serine hydrolase [Idiomarina tyrosinivorans]RUO81068.1 serine hydrolase [Idiomarina tyrosinivorans]